MNPEDAEFGYFAAPPDELAELPLYTRKWIADLTPEKIARLQRLDRLADDVDPDRIKELVSIAEKAETLRKAGVWVVAGIFALVIAVASLIEASERIWTWLKGLGHS